MEQITIREIAKLCGVGVSTVSRAINNHPDINEETKVKILETIRKYNYVPNNSARNLKRAESRMIAVLVKGISNPFFGTIIQTLEREIVRDRYTFFLQQVEDSEDEVEVAIQLEKEKRLKGIIFLGGMVRHSKDSLDRLTVPYVISTVNMELPEEQERGAVVSIDDEEESCRMVSLLCEMGHRRIAILTAPENDMSIGRSRLDGYLRALKEHNIEIRDELILHMKRDEASYTLDCGYEMAKELIARLQGEKLPDCVYGVSDTLAIGACKALFDAGYHVPEDISVAGFDGLDIAQYYHPDIMTVCQPREEMAEETVRILLRMIRGKTVNRRVIFKAQIQNGASVRKIQQEDE